MNHEITMNTRRRFNFYKTLNTTLPIICQHLTDSETMLRDHVQLTVNIIFFSVFYGFQLKNCFKI